MPYLRTMGANVNQIQYGDKLQGLPSVTDRHDDSKHIVSCKTSMTNITL
jgi:hypothetical protein